MSTKLFTFNASSFSLEAKVESLLRSRGAITLDFGSSAYINSDLMPLILSDLVEKSSGAVTEELVSQLKAEMTKIDLQRQKLTEDGIKIVQQLRSATAEITTLKTQLESAYKIIDSLKSECVRLRSNQTNAPSSSFDRTQYEKVLSELRQIKSQNVEAITSLKVLEDENDELRKEIDTLKVQANTAPASKAI